MNASDGRLCINELLVLKCNGAVQIMLTMPNSLYKVIQQLHLLLRGANLVTYRTLVFPDCTAVQP